MPTDPRGPFQPRRLRAPSEDAGNFLRQEGRGGVLGELGATAYGSEERPIGNAGSGLPGADPSHGLVTHEAVVGGLANLMDLLIRNQHHTLTAVGSEIQREWGLIEGCHAAVASEFQDSYETLARRERHQKLLLDTVSALVAGSLSISVIQLLRYSVPKSLVIPSLLAGLLAGLAMVACQWAYKRLQRRKAA